MTQLKVLAHSLTAEVEITVLHANIVTAIGIVFNCERRSRSLVEDVKFTYNYFNVTCRYIRILALTFAYYAGCLNYIFTAKVRSLLAEFRINILAEYKLCHAITVAQVNECHTTHLACTLYPTA